MSIKSKTHKKSRHRGIEQNVTQRVTVKIGDDVGRTKKSSKRRRRRVQQKEQYIPMQIPFPAPVIYQSSSIIPYPVYKERRAEPDKIASSLEDIGLLGRASILDTPTKSEQLADMIEPVKKAVEYEKATREASEFWTKEIQKPPRYEGLVAKPPPQNIPLQPILKPQSLDISKISSEPIQSSTIEEPIKTMPLGDDKNIMIEKSIFSNIKPMEYSNIEELKKSSSELSKKLEAKKEEFKAQKEVIYPWGLPEAVEEWGMSPKQVMGENLDFFSPISIKETSTQTTQPKMEKEVVRRERRSMPKYNVNSWDYQLQRYNALSTDKDLTMNEAKEKYGKLKDFKNIIESMA